MSYKYQAQKINNSQWILEKSVSTPIHIFMNQSLYDHSEELMWQQAAWATTIPSVKKVVVTPDGHAGAGVPIGIVVATKDYIAPCAAGYDISCGMASLRTKLTSEDIADKKLRRQWINEVESRVSLGIGKHRVDKQIDINSKLFDEILQHGILAFKHIDKNIKDNFEKQYHRVNDFVKYERATKRGSHQLSSLGGGNHFLELQQDDEGNIYIMIHTGSRGYGHQIATDFFNEGLEWWNENHKEQLSKGQKEKISFPVDSNIGKRYLNAMNQAANFAIANRYLISKAVIESTEKVFKDSPELIYEISHNLVQFENNLWVHRKGATRALPANNELLRNTKFEKTGHPILIPGSMGTSSAILTAKDSEKSLYSVNHGCGRVMGRADAKRRSIGTDEQKKKILLEGKHLLPNQEQLNNEMDEMDILYNTRNVPIDECLHCYKDIDEVLDTVEQANLAKIDTRLYPRAVIKGND